MVFCIYNYFLLAKAAIRHGSRILQYIERWDDGPFPSHITAELICDVWAQLYLPTEPPSSEERYDCYPISVFLVFS